ncbi:hypothetical protein P171DRAFT_436675 [Karstenula rhodostoma CBS 690.94]|uniref:Uncharacterized protein n=1 Tax=Karstenula rhodostoma CBS 690.94 TaxID=1392251 RepID=A0A9P4U776_9PLEO|nr:hypothetical protein P171DRAFT_436675 [Karstenula rhodostoma CBS 690.94]
MPAAVARRGLAGRRAMLMSRSELTPLSFTLSYPIRTCLPSFILWSLLQGQDGESVSELPHSSSRRDRLLCTRCASSMNPLHVCPCRAFFHRPVYLHASPRLSQVPGSRYTTPRLQRGIA